jgi:hypothetical protein
MWDLQCTTESAIIIRNALRMYKERWSGGHPSEQEAIAYLETQFTRLVLESYMDAD